MDLWDTGGGIPPELLASNALALGILCWHGIKEGKYWDIIYNDVIIRYNDIIAEKGAEFDKNQLRTYYLNHYSKALKYWEQVEGATYDHILSFIDRPIVISTDIPEGVFLQLSPTVRTIVNITTAAVKFSQKG